MARSKVQLMQSQGRLDYAVFRAWADRLIASGQLKASSLKIYQSMWAKLVGDNPADITTLNDDQLSLVIRKATADSPTSYPKRVAQLVSRVMAYHYLEKDPAKSEAYEKFHERFDDNRPKAPKFANQKAKDHYRDEIQAKAHWPSMGWKEKRNLALAAVGLFAGLKLSEIIHLRFVDMRYIPHLGQYMIDVQGANKRSVPMHQDGTRYLHEWIEVRQGFMTDETKKPGAYLFIATTTGTQISRVTAYRCIKDVLGLSSNATRNTFAITNIAVGNDKALVAKWLGYRNEENLEKFTQEASLMAFMKTISA